MNDVLNVNNPRLRIPGKQYTLSAAALRNSQTRDCEKPARNGLPIASPNEFYDFNTTRDYGNSMLRSS